MNSVRIGDAAKRIIYRVIAIEISDIAFCIRLDNHPPSRMGTPAGVKLYESIAASRRRNIALILVLSGEELPRVIFFAKTARTQWSLLFCYTRYVATQTLEKRI